MATIYPFCGLRADPKLASQVASVPYDVLNSAEAKTLVANNPHSFLHVTKPEIDMPNDVDPYSDAVYQHGAQNLKALIANGTLIRDPAPALYIYALTMNDHTQTGIVLGASIDEYEKNLVRKHEYTRPDKEDDRTRHIEILQAQTGTVFLLHKDSDTLASLIKTLTTEDAIVDFIAEDNVRHQLWPVTDETQIKSIVTGFADNGPLYIADGHHRSAAALRVKKSRQNLGLHSGNAEQDDPFLAVSFPFSEMKILPYNRVIKDLNGLSATAFLVQVAKRFDVVEGKTKLKRGTFGLYLKSKWYTLTTRAASFDANDPVDCLDVSILQKQLLSEILNITDPRRDKRIDFVGGIRGDDELIKRVDQEGYAAAIAMYPTAIEDLITIADAEQVMPPKSTWFEPKLRDGMVIHLL